MNIDFQGATVSVRHLLVGPFAMRQCYTAIWKLLKADPGRPFHDDYRLVGKPPSVYPVMNIWACWCALRCSHLWRGWWGGNTISSLHGAWPSFEENEKDWLDVVSWLWQVGGDRGGDLSWHADGVADRFGAAQTVMPAEGTVPTASDFPVLRSTRLRSCSWPPGNIHRCALEASTRASLALTASGSIQGVELDKQVSAFGSLVSAILYTQEHGSFLPSGELDWWWYLRTLLVYSPEWLDVSSTNRMLERLRGEPHRVLRRCLIEVWRLRGFPDWDIVWAAREGGYTT